MQLDSFLSSKFYYLRLIFDTLPIFLLREAAKKCSFLNGRANKRGRGGKGLAIKEERTYFGT